MTETTPKGQINTTPEFILTTQNEAIEKFNKSTLPELESVQNESSSTEKGPEITTSTVGETY